MMQTADNKKFSTNNFKIVSRKKPSRKTFNNLLFALMFVDT